MPDDVLQALIVDDERLARRALRSALDEHGDVEVVAEARTVDEAAAALREQAPDVVFLDIQMRGETGFDLLDHIDRPLRVVFVTAYDEYAVRAFEVNALDYLLKPVDPERLAEALRRARESEGALPQQPAEASDAFRYDDLFFYEEGRRPQFIRIREIAFIRAAGNYTEVHLAGGSMVLTSMTLSRWDERLPGDHFVRIHRSTIAGLDKVERIERAASGTYAVHIAGYDDPLDMSRRRAQALKDRLT